MEPLKPDDHDRAVEILKEIRMFSLIGISAALGLAAAFLINQL